MTARLLMAALFLAWPTATTAAAHPAPADTLAARALLRRAFQISDSKEVLASGGENHRAEIVLTQWSIGDREAALREIRGMRPRLGWAGDDRVRETTAGYMEIASGLRRRGEIRESQRMAEDIARLPRHALMGREPVIPVPEVAAFLYAAGDTTTAITLMKASLGDSLFEAMGLALIAQRMDKADWGLALELVRRAPPGRAHESVLNNVSLSRAHAGDWQTAERVAGALPEDHRGKSFILVLAAEAARQADDRRAFDRLIESALRAATARPREAFTFNSTGRIAAGLIRSGQSERAMRILEGADSGDERIATLELARVQALTGNETLALATLDEARTLKPSFALTDAWRDDGMVDWITELADSSRDSTALHAVDHIHYGFTRGWALGKIAAAEAGRGRLEDARRTFERIEHCPDGACEALVALAEAEARQVSLAAALATLAQIPAVCEAQCNGPMDPAPGFCGHPYTCPPLELGAGSRVRGLVAIGRTRAGQEHLDDLLRGAPPAAQIDILLAAANGRLQGESALRPRQ